MAPVRAVPQERDCHGKLSEVKVIFLVNARSGARRRYDIDALIRGGCGTWLPVPAVISCGSKDELDGIVDDAEADGVDVVCAVGGDGTVHELAKRLVGRTPALGVVPTGSGNGFARHLGIPLEPLQAMEAIRTGRIESVDAAEVNGHRFAGLLGVGFDAVVAHRFAASHARGLRTYVQEGAFAYREYQAGDYTIVAGEHSRAVKAFAIAVANSNQYGNHALVAPLASMRDGLLDVVIIEQPTIFRAPFLLAQLFYGTFDRAEGVTTFQVPELTIARHAPGPAHLDGEPVLLGDTLSVRILPNALRVVVPGNQQKF
jgi:diacylglycerol kinase (ATP)